MRFNLKVRLRNPVFWATVIPAIGTFAYTMLSCFDIFPPIAEETLVSALLAIVSALSTLGVLNDPTTKGLADSELAMTYEKPKG